jgi:phage baseplate assembly protein W
MENIFLDLPIQFNGLRFKTTSLVDSISKIVSVVFSTPAGSVACDKNFGTIQMDPDKVLVEIGKIKDDLSRTVKIALEKNEPRVENISVKIHGGQRSTAKGTTPLTVSISGTIAATGREFRLEKVLKEDYYRTPFPGRMG